MSYFCDLFVFCVAVALFVAVALKEMNFWVPGSAAPGVDREYEEEGVYMVNNTQTRMSLDQQVCSISPALTSQRHDLPIYKYRREILLALRLFRDGF